MTNMELKPALIKRLQADIILMISMVQKLVLIAKLLQVTTHTINIGKKQEVIRQIQTA